MGSDLAYAPASYRATLCNGALITAISTLLHILFFAGVCGVVIYFEEVRGTPPPVVTSSWFFPFWFLVPNALGFLGYFLLSTPNPSLTITESRWSARKILRLTLVLQAIAIILQLGISSAGFAANFFPPGSSSAPPSNSARSPSRFWRGSCNSLPPSTSAQS